MYRYSNGQISLTDFKQPVGMNLKESNRWVKKAQTVPWLEIEKRYAAVFTNRRGNVAKPLRPAPGRPRKDETRDRAQDDRDECHRVEVERRFSLAKRKCGMGLVTAKLRETAAHVIAMSVLVLNLRKIQYAFLRLLTYLLAVFLPQQKMVIVSVDISIIIA